MSTHQRCRFYIHGKVKFGITREVNAISTIIVAVIAVVILAHQRLPRRSNRLGVDGN